jgi:MATE family multidrug resistance protein
MQPASCLRFRWTLKEVASISWPLIVGMLSFTIMDVTDTLMVGWLGKSELAAVGMATTVQFLINSFFIGFFESVKILVAQATGAGQRDVAERAGWQGILLALPCGALVIALALFDQKIFELFGGPLSLQLIAREYFVIRVFASPFWFVLLALSSYYQGIGNTKLPMRINIFVCLLNIVLCLVLIFGFGPIPGYGVAGSAWATAISTAVGMAIILWHFVKNVQTPWGYAGSLVKRLINLGLPVGVRWLLDTGGWTFLIALIARLGETELAANQIAVKIMCLSILPVYGIAETACILTGQCTGAQDMVALKKSYWSCIQLAMMIMVSFGLVFLIMPGVLISAFQSDTDVIQLGAQVLMIIALFQILAAFSMVTAGALNGTGDTRFTMIMSVTTTWLLMVPSAYGFGIWSGYGVVGMWFALIMQELALSIAYRLRFRSGGWKNHQAIELHQTRLAGEI